MSEWFDILVSFWSIRIASASAFALVIIPIAWAIEKSWREMPPAWRSWMWRLVFVKLLAVLAVPFAIELPLLPAGAADSVTRAPDALTPETIPVEATSPHVEVANEVPRSSVDSSIPPRVANRIDARTGGGVNVLAIVFGLWGMGVTANMAIVAVRYAMSRRLVGRKHYVVDGTAFQALRNLYHRFALSKCPDLVATQGEGSPFVADWIRPAIYCPSNWLSTCGLNEMRLAFAHELAHLARGDLAWNRVVAACQVLLFFHPAVWLAIRRYGAAQEIACDELALARTGGSPVELARLLVGFVEQLSARSYGVAAMTGVSVTIRERVLAMNGRSAVCKPGFLATAAAMIAAALILTPWTLGKEKDKPQKQTDKQQQSNEQQGASGGFSASASASGSATAGGSSSSGKDGGGDIAVQANASATIGSGKPRKEKQQQSDSSAKKFNKKIDASASLTTNTKDGKTTTAKKRKVSISDENMDLEITETEDRVMVKVTDHQTSEEKTYIAKNAKELEEKYPEGYALYKEHMKKVKISDSGISASASSGEGPDLKLPDLKLPDLDKGPSAKELMKKQLDEMLNKPEVKGTPLEQMIRDMRDRMEKNLDDLPGKAFDKAEAFEKSESSDSAEDSKTDVKEARDGA